MGGKPSFFVKQVEPAEDGSKPLETLPQLLSRGASQSHLVPDCIVQLFTE